MTEEQKIKLKEWTTRYINDLPDSCFAYIAPGGKKDKEGKTVPRSLRKLPYKDANGKVDLPHLRNAIARAPQTVGIPRAMIPKIQAKLRKILERIKEKTKMTFPMCTDGLCFTDKNYRTEIQVLKLGNWNHPQYGRIKIDEKDLEEFVKNFEGGVRRDIPITEGHPIGEEEKPAVGWFKKLINKGRDGLWATVEWTKRGKKLLEEKAYKYFSPEFYRVYEDPETHKRYSNVLTGGALTNFPYFKGLQAIVFSESMFEGDNMATLEEVLEKDVDELTEEEKKVIKENADKLSDEDREKFEDILEGDEESGETEEETEEEGTEEDNETESEGTEEEKKEEDVSDSDSGETEANDSNEDENEERFREIDLRIKKIEEKLGLKDKSSDKFSEQASEEANAESEEKTEKESEEESGNAEEDKVEFSEATLVYEKLLREGKLVPAQKKFFIDLYSTKGKVRFGEKQVDIRKALLNLLENQPGKVDFSEKGVNEEEKTEEEKTQEKNEEKKEAPEEVLQYYEQKWGKTREEAQRAWEIAQEDAKKAEEKSTIF